MAISDNHAPPGVVAAGSGASWLALVPARAGMITRSLGAVVSLALLVGVGVWGYRLLVRDMTGVPVVRAMEGPMRETPGAPGVDAVPHLGLSVNEVAAAGQAAPTEDRLLLAPVTPALSDADMLAMSTAEADEPRPADVSADVSADFSSGTLEIPVVAIVTGAEPVADARLLAPAAPASLPEATATDPGVTAASPAPLTAEQVLALADQIAAGTPPLAALASGADVPPVVLLDGAVQVAVIDRAVPGVATALIPPSRPARAVIAAATGGADDAAASPETDPIPDPVLAPDLPPGTTLVQLGAYETPQIAAREWAVLSTRFAPFLTGKTQVIQQASSGGRTFFRLRAMGYADMDDARRFCAALAAEAAACIPVVVR